MVQRSRIDRADVDTYGPNPRSFTRHINDPHYGLAASLPTTSLSGLAMALLQGRITLDRTKHKHVPQHTAVLFDVLDDVEFHMLARRRKIVEMRISKSEGGTMIDGDRIKEAIEFVFSDGDAWAF